MAAATGHSWETDLAAGERVVLAEGDTFSLGGSKTSFRLVETSSPAVRVRQVGMGRVREAEGGLLVLPDDDSPLASLFLDAQGRWLCELGEERRPVSDQERLRVGETDWVVELPATVETVDDGLRAMDSIHLRIGVSRDEEHVRMVVVSHGQEQELPTRSHHYLLATLARVWLSEQDVPEPERGWVDREQLCRMLATDTNKLNVDIHRARRQFSTLGIREAASLVERRPGTGQMRLGVRSVEVFKL